MEFVYVVPREDLFPDCYPHGLVPFADEAERRAFVDRVRERGFYVERDVAERRPAWKQIIPYTVVVRGDEVLLLRRLAQGGEARLHDKLSIGVGGHINPVDVAGDAESDSREREPIREGTRRELEEELVLEGEWDLRPVGVLNDDSNPVGAVHAGVVQVLTLNRESNARIREADVLEGTFIEQGRLSSLLAEGANFETWSALLVDRLTEILTNDPSPLLSAGEPAQATTR